MFDVTTEHALRLRRSRAPRVPSATPEPLRSSRVCIVCGREIALDEQLFLVHKEVHCSQCHGMLEYELGKDRERDKEARTKGTKWEKGGRTGPPDAGGEGSGG